MWNKSWFVAVTVEKFRVSGREVLLRVAADVLFFFASGTGKFRLRATYFWQQCQK